MADTTRRPHVVVLGGGFAGLEAVKVLRGKPVEVTLVDRANHHTFQPLLYQVASAVLSPGQITAPLRQVFHKAANVAVVLDEAVGVDLDRRVVRLAHGEIAYDFLVVATGATHAYFGHPEWEPLAPGLKTIEDALDIRRRILLAFELAERRGLAGEGARAPTFAVVGAGPTGVELAGAIADIARDALAGDFRAIDPRDARVVLVEGQDRVLPPYPNDLSASARRQLEELGVEVRTGSLVTAIAPDGIEINGDEALATDVVLWASGVRASALGAALGAPTDRAGRVEVAPDLTLPGRPEVFVTGDLATLEQDGEPLPGVAQVAMQQGKAAARNILATLAGAEREAFRYRDPGQMATIGRRRAVAVLGKLHLSGLFAWLAWLFVHVLFLIGFHNRLMVMREWAWAYFTKQRSARLITGSRELPGEPGAPGG